MSTYIRIALSFSLAFAAHLGAQTVTLISGNGQMVYEQFLTVSPMVIQAKDATGHPVPGLTVTWSVTQGAGTVNNANPAPSDVRNPDGSLTFTTDSNGMAGALFHATSLNPGTSFESEKVTAATSFGSVSFFVSTVLVRTSSGGNAIPPSVTMVTPPFENRSLTGASGSTLAGGVVVQVFDENGFQGGPVPNVGVRIVNYPDMTLPPPAMCNAPQGVALTDHTGTATCDLVITAPAGSAAFTVEVGEFLFTARVLLQVTPGVSCSYALNGSNLSAGVNGGPATVNVNATPGCPWTALSNANWITVNSGTNGAGNGTVSFTIAANTGNARTGTLTIAGQTFTVNQAAGVFSGLGITTPGPALSGGSIGQRYSVVLSATGGQPPYRWSTSGTLPPGVGPIDPNTGLLAGTPTNAGTFAFTATVTDNLGGQQSQNFTITISSTGPVSGFTITNTGFPNGVVNQAYPQQLLNTSGACVTPFFPSPVFSVSAGKLPDGLAIVRGQPDSIGGTPTTQGQFNFTLSARDACGNTATASYSITITGTPTTQLMSVSPSPIAFSLQLGSPNVPPDQTININANTGVLNFSAVLNTTSGGNWLVARSATSGVTPGSFTVGVANFANLAPGVYNGTITITSQAANSPVVIQVTLTVTGGPTATLSLTPTFFVVNQMASSNPTPARLNIAVTSTPTAVHFTVVTQTTSGGPWLTATPLQGDTPNLVTGIVNVAGLAPGTYTGSIILTPSGGAPQTVTVTLNVLQPPGISTSATSLTFTFQQSGAAPPTQNLLLSSSTGSALSLSITTATQLGNWLFVDRPNGLTPFNVVVSVNPTGLVSGTYNGSITFTASDTSVAPLTVNVTLIVNQQTPVIAAVVNAASFAPGPIAPGEIITIFGSNLGPLVPVGLQVDPASGKVATLLAGTQVFVNGVLAPMVFASAGQVSAIVPYATPTLGATFVQVQFQGLRSEVFVVRLIDATPGIFLADPSGQGAILNQDQTPNSAQNGALPNTTVSIYATGEGQTDPPGVDGTINGNSPPIPHLKVTVQIDGLAADVSYAGGAPGLVEGVMQVNAKVPAGVRRGVAVPVVITVGTAPSQAGVTLFVRQ